MGDTINQRLRHLVDIGKIDAPKMYGVIGASRNVWSGWINSGKPIPLAKIQQITSNSLWLNSRWLLTGEGEILNTFKVQSTSIHGDMMGGVEGVCCSDCIEKQKRIDCMKDKLADVQEKYIGLLEELYRKKNSKNYG